MSVAILSLVGNEFDRMAATDFKNAFAGNTGNALIQFGLESLLPKAKISPNISIAASDGTEQIILGLANFLSAAPMSESLITLINEILLFMNKKKHAKVIISSIGCDFSSIFSSNEIVPQRLEFVKKVAEQSNFVGARGFLTAQALSDCGIENIWVVGCPAFSFPISENPFKDQLNTQNDLVVGWKPDGHLRSFYRNFLVWASSHDATCIVQENGERLRIGSTDGRLIEDPTLEKSLEYFCWPSSDLADPLKKWLVTKSRWAPTYRHWNSIMAEHELSVNCRIHGTAAALASGVNALHVNVDSRTTELSQFHRIPNVNYQNLWFPSDLNEIRELAAVPSHFESRPYFHNNFNSFFLANGISKTEIISANGKNRELSEIRKKPIKSSLVDFQSREIQFGLKTFEKMLEYRLNSVGTKEVSVISALVTELILELGLSTNPETTRLLTHFAPTITHGLNIQNNPKLATQILSSLGFSSIKME